MPEKWYKEKLQELLEDKDFAKEFFKEEIVLAATEAICETLNSYGFGQLREYQKYEFCKAVGCPDLGDGVCCAHDDTHCILTARQFHHWLKSEGYRIVKEG